MKEKILLTNLGNRNITFNAKTYQEYSFSKSTSNDFITFRDWTFQLLENWDKYKSDLEINIINPLLTSNKTYDLIIFFYSNQESFKTRIEQDTIFEAKIIEKILIEKYGYEAEKVQTIWVSKIVIDNSGLLSFYRNEINRLKKIREGAFFTICDAGGTAQQKMALKVIAEFMLKPSQHEVLYVENNSLVSDIDVNGYRNVINAEHSITLINHGEYMAAAELLDIDYTLINTKNWKNILFLHVFYRFIQNRQMAKKAINALPTVKNPILAAFIQKEGYAENKKLLDFFGSAKWMDLTDLFYKVVFFFNQKKFSQAILIFAHFYETFLLEAFGREFAPSIYGSRYNQTKEQESELNKLFYHYYAEFVDKNPDFRVQVESIMVQVMLLKVSKNTVVMEIACKLSPFFSYTNDSAENIRYINNIRNSIAHNGKIFTYNEFNRELPYFKNLMDELKIILGLKSEDLFKELNLLLENNIRS